MKRICLILIFGVVLLLAGGCATKADEPATRTIFAMDTVMTLTAYGDQAEEALDAAEQDIIALDQMLSTEDPNSEIYALNSSGFSVLSETTAYLVEQALAVSDMTGNAFDPLIYPLMKAWGFPDQEYRVPDPDEIDALLPLLDPEQVSFDSDDGRVEFETPGMMIDLGGIAKGYTSAFFMETFQKYGMDSALVNLGGNVEALGSKPDGSAWKVAIQDPEDPSSYISVLEIRDQAVITSGGYERYFEENGQIYHHILDPSTGYPSDSGVLSVSIISSNGTLADAMSTALFVLGVEQGSEIWREHADQFDVIFLTDDHRLYVSEGVFDDVASSEYPVTVITK